MRLQNRHGQSVDAVPFVVVTGMALMFLVSFGPLYGTMLGLSIEAGVGASLVVFVGCGCGAYYRLVWTVDPAVRTEIPAHVRFRNLGYAALAFFFILVLLLIPVVYQMYF